MKGLARIILHQDFALDILKLLRARGVVRWEAESRLKGLPLLLLSGRWSRVKVVVIHRCAPVTTTRVRKRIRTRASRRGRISRKQETGRRNGSVSMAGGRDGEDGCDSRRRERGAAQVAERGYAGRGRAAARKTIARRSQQPPSDLRI